ncbi:hypothetical protein [Scatolibacter rhodanostii]|uniref:hypothetical protein n=1 Tax=Scatolibacter rhodanostii TaxID=2014781 RepID=UPI000C07ECF0|nr:hypothetical protein [Scatolibacter rhodanostii]
MEKISLQKRLEMTVIEKTANFKAFELNLDTYFVTLSEMSQNNHFRQKYNQIVLKYPECAGKSLSQIVYDTDTEVAETLEMTEQERDALLYDILIEPFVLLQKNRIKKESYL